MSNLRLEVSNEEIADLFMALDRNNDGVINYVEFVEIVKGQLPVMRRSLIEKTFKHLDRKNIGYLDLTEVKGLYDVSQHPEVLAGRRREGQVLADFVDSLEEYLELKGITNQIVSLEEFSEYYSFVSATIDDDKYFTNLLTGVWRLNKITAPRDDVQYNIRSKLVKDNKQGPPIKEKEEISVDKHVALLINRFRSRLALRGPRGFFNFHRQLQSYDTNGDELITTKEFLKLLKDFKVDITEQDAHYLFAVYDKNNEGTINIEKFMDAVVGEMSDDRARMVGAAWRKVDKDQEGSIEMTVLKTYFVHCRNHPDVKSGKKDEDAVLEEFIDTLETHQQIVIIYILSTCLIEIS